MLNRLAQSYIQGQVLPRRQQQQYVQQPLAVQPKPSPFGNFGRFTKDNSGALISLGANMLGGNTPAGLAQFGTALQANQKRSQTAAWIAKHHPELAGLAEIDPAAALKMAMQPQSNAAPKTVRYFHPETGQEQVAQWVDGGWQDMGGSKLPSGWEITSDGKGGLTMRQGPLGSGKKGLTELQAKQVSFSERMKTSGQKIKSLENSGYDPANLRDGTAREAGLPGNYAMTDEGRQYVTAAREWISGVLRLDSGAAVPEEEFWRYFKTYFPQPGDDELTIQQKRQQRDTVEFSIRKGSGGVIEQADQDMPTPTPGGNKTISEMSDEELEALANGG